jgi:glycosyltransferase involved in cell wall biosynthesis
VARLDDQEKYILKKRYLERQKRLVVFFGFVYPHKGLELLFDIADPVSDRIIIAGEVKGGEDYAQKIMMRASTGPWAEKVTITGFLSAGDAAALLSIADAVILPFRTGGGDWNTTIDAAVLNGAFVITTSLSRSGYDKKRNIYFAKVDDIRGMRAAIAAHAGTRRGYDADIDKDEWGNIAREHRLLYESILAGNIRVSRA